MTEARGLAIMAIDVGGYSRMTGEDEAGRARAVGRLPSGRRRLHPHEFIRRFLMHVLAQGLPPHPPLRPVRRHDSGSQHRTRPPIAGRAKGRARERPRGGRPRDRNTFVCAPMPVLRRPDDHRRDLRRSAPWALSAAEPDQDRHLMIITAHPASHRRFSLPQAARRRRTALRSQDPHVLSKRRASLTPAYPRDRTRSSSSFLPAKLRASGPQGDASKPSAILKSP